ncbi:MAG: lipoyl(octanoyl) transferase LipB [Holosporales bacterium]|jgi:lipoate-protein ligase B|nr:lipoyl(octanoyl) transferase LipB [Holosporales bacterium]
MTVKFIEYGLSKYPIALLDMEIACESIVHGGKECVFITEHEPLYSAGKSFENKDFLTKLNFPIYYPKRGGRVTVHSPGQIVLYPIINLRKRNLNVSEYVKILENWIIEVLATFQITSRLSDDGIGVWVNDAKIGFIGIRIEKGVSSHGLCLNVSNDLSMFKAIAPCGISGLRITSINNEVSKNKVTIARVAKAFIETSPF